MKKSVTRTELNTLRDRVDLLEIASAEKRKPWYKQRPSLISLLALIGSVVTFIISQRGFSRQEIRVKQDQLVAILMNIADLDKEARTHPQDQIYLDTLTTKRKVWLDAAESLASELEGHLSASEYSVLAGEKEIDQEYEKAEQYLLSCVKAARDRDAQASALNSLGALCLWSPNKDVNKANNYFEAALSTLGDAHDDHTNYMRGYLYEYRANSERQVGITDNLNDHVKKARECYNALPTWHQGRISGLQRIASQFPEVKD